MKQAISILIGYLTCTDAAVKTKWANLLASFWHKDEGKLVTSITTAANGDVKIVIIDGAGNSETTTIAKTQLPTSYDISFINGLQNALNSKVATVPGKGLSTHDFTTALKTKLDGLSNYTHPATHSISEVAGLQTELNKIKPQDGRAYHKIRSNDTEDVAPTAAEVAAPIDGDTVIIRLSNNVIELWERASNAWTKNTSISTGVTLKNHQDVARYTGSEAKFDQSFAVSPTGEVSLRETGWVSIAMYQHVTSGTLKYRISGNVVEIVGYHIISNHSDPNKGWLCALPANIRPPSLDGTRIILAYSNSTRSALAMEFNSQGLRYSNWNTLPSSYIDFQIIYIL